ncbi:CENP-S associating centromere protein X-domain-containing protein [Scheffersomyces amazonensis]|uniref:CENP-S associating centromere protein X-domain-containing protein n=1 Tax=Scheffersomyces amazonensis TaxID=1078765 RepID=UPI00315D5AEC
MEPESIDNGNQPNIPIATIARIFREISFKNDNTRITQTALELSSQYISLFINEAILRSNEERIVEGDELDKVDGIDGIEENQRQTHQVDRDEQELDDIGDEDVIDPPESQTQFGVDQEHVKLSESLDSHHLSKIAGVLILDF